MSVGSMVDKTQIDMASGTLARQIETWSQSVLRVKAFLDATPDANLETAPFNYTAQEVAVLKSAMSDLALIANIYKGNANLATARDLGVFSRQLQGLMF